MPKGIRTKKVGAKIKLTIELNEADYLKLEKPATDQYRTPQLQPGERRGVGMTTVGERVFRAFTLGSDARRDAEAAVAASRNGGYAPVAVWVNPAVPEFQLDGVSVVRDRRMSKWMVYVEETAEEPEALQLSLI